MIELSGWRRAGSIRCALALSLIGLLSVVVTPSLGSAAGTLLSLQQVTGHFNQPTSVAFAGDKAWITDRQGKNVVGFVYPGRSFETLEAKQFGFVSPTDGASNGEDVWVVDDKNQITEFSSATGKLVRLIKGSAYKFDYPHALAIEGRTLWVANNFSVEMLNTSSDAFERTVHFGASRIAPDEICASPYGLWVATLGNVIYQVNAKTGTVSRTVSGKQGRFDPDPYIACDSQHVWLLNSLNGPGSIVELNASNGKYVRTIRSKDGDISGATSIVSNGEELWIGNDAQSGRYYTSMAGFDVRTGDLIKVVGIANINASPSAEAIRNGQVWDVDSDINEIFVLNAVTGAAIRVIR